MWFHFSALPLTLNLALLGLGASSALGQDQSARSSDLPKLSNQTKTPFENLQELIETFPLPDGAIRVQYRHLPLVNLNKKAQQLLEREISDIESISNEHIVVSVPRDRIRSIRSPALEALFPTHDFVFIPHDRTKRPGSTANVALPAFLFQTLAIDARAGTAASFSSIGEAEDFCSFLAAQKVTLKTEDDAARVYQALCAVLNRRRFSGKHLREGDGHWKLDWHTYRQTTASKKYATNECYYEITTDEKGTVLSGRLRIIRIPDAD